MKLKQCIKCGEVKPYDEFHKDNCRPDGHFPYCKRCRRKDPEKYDEIQENESKGLHYCTSCKQWLPSEDFYPNPSKKNGLHNYCKPCARADAKRYFLENTEKIKARDKRRYWNNVEREQRRYKKWYNDNAERQRKKSREWHKKNYYRVRKKRLAYHKKWQKVRGKQWYKEYYNTTKGRFVTRRAQQKRRELSKQVPNTLTHDEWVMILESQDYTCLGCGRKFGDNLKPTMDHIIPLSKGGGLTKENVQALCHSCNSRKNNKTLDLRKNKPKWGNPKQAYQQLKLF